MKPKFTCIGNSCGGPQIYLLEIDDKQYIVNKSGGIIEHVSKHGNKHCAICGELNKDCTCETTE